MPAYRGRPFRFTWGSAFVNTLDAGFPLDGAVSYPVPRAGSEVAQGASGIEDAWDAGVDEFLAGAFRWIPKDTGTSPAGLAMTGWEGATGVGAFVSYARKKNVVRFYPDRVTFPAVYLSCYLVEPMEGPPALEADYTRRLDLVLRTSDGVAWTGY